MQQLALSLSEPSRRSGARAGAGRKKLAAALRRTPHRARPVHRGAHPVHVTLRASLRSLRIQQVAHTVLGAIRASNRRGFRAAHYSVQPNHLHLLVEAENKQSLSAGVRGLMVRLARRVNRLLFRRRRFWADRWHGHTLKSPREVRNALVYVLQNRAKHARPVNVGARASPLDALSSAQHFDGSVEPLPRALRSVGPPCVVRPRTWLLRIGWQRRGRISQFEIPKS